MSSAAKILVVDDEAPVRLVLRRFLTAAGYVMIECRDGAEAVLAAQRETPAAVILDVQMPHLDGWQTLRRLRDDGCHAPVLMLTNEADVASRVKGLDEGADDYLGKPYDWTELLARLRALLRRPLPAAVRLPRLRFGDTIVDLERKSARRGDESIHLTRTEYAMLDLLARNAGKPVGREQLWVNVWKVSAPLNSHTLDTHVWRLRKKLGDGPGEARWIRNLPGIGFVLECDVVQSEPAHAMSSVALGRLDVGLAQPRI